MAKTITGIDVGLRNAKFVRGFYRGNNFHVTDFAVNVLGSKEIPEGWAELAAPFKLGEARVGLTGRDVNIRYARVPRVPDWQLRNLMRFEVEEIGDQSGVGVASDFNLLPQLPEIEGEDVVLLAMARESLLEEHQAGLARLGGKLDAFTPNAIALYNAWLRYGVLHDETVLLANIGYDNLDVVIARGPDLLFARNLVGGSRLFEEAIAQRFQVSAEKACEIKETLASLDPAAKNPDPTAERARTAILGAAGQLLSLLQSTVLFCKSQVKISGLKLDRVLICGGGAALDGLPKYLSSGLSVPVDLFDPFKVIDVSALAPEAARELETYKLESVIALGLASQACDPEAWSIEILPKNLAKQRAFWGGTVWLAAAGVLALGYLGYDAWRTSSELAKVRLRAASLDQQYKKANQTHRKTEELATENTRLAAYAEQLQHTQGSGEQLARSLGWLEQNLPGDFWVSELATEFRADPELRIARGSERPIVTVKGKAREGTNSLATLYEQFVTQMHTKLPKEGAFRERLTPSGSQFSLDFSLFAPPLDAPASDAAKPEQKPNPKSDPKPAKGH